MPGAHQINLPSSSGAQDKPVCGQRDHLSAFYVASCFFSNFINTSQYQSHHAETPAAKAHIAATLTSGIINTSSALLDNLLAAE